MLTLGETIKNRRKEMNLTQNELCEGICTQATISNLENNQTGTAIETLISLLDRLKLDIIDIMPLIASQDEHSSILNEVKRLCSLFKHKEAYELLVNSLDFSNIEANHDKKEYYYYKGITSLSGYQNFSDAHYNFNLGLALVDNKTVEFVDILSTNGIAIAYFLENEKEKARTYFEKTVKDLEEFRSRNSTIDTIEAAKIYFNTAKFYSSIDESKHALGYINIGINLYQQADRLQGLENLLYEKAFNLSKIGEIKEASLFFFHAASLARLSGNNEVIDTIKSDMKNLNIELFDYAN